MFVQDGQPLRVPPATARLPGAGQDPIETISPSGTGTRSGGQTDRFDSQSPATVTPQPPTPEPAAPPAPIPAPDQSFRTIPLLDEHPLTADDKQELERYGNRLRQEVGALLTPPAGTLSPEVKFARDYVRTLVHELAGAELEQAGMHVVVNLYSSEEVNAFALKDPTLQQPGLLRRLTGYAVDGQPIYEIGVNLGTLRQLEHKEELAFILGHELTHILKGHTEEIAPDDRARLKRWVASQANEVVADAGGIEKMVRAGYDPEGALSALNRMHRREQSADSSLVIELFKALKAGAASHHHEGVRLSAAQAQVEHLRRTESAALPSEHLTPLPAFELGDPTRLPVPRKEFEKVAQEVASMAEAMLDPGKRLARQGQFGSYHFLPPGKELDPELSWRNSNELRGEVFMQAVRRLDKAAAGGQQKVDAALHLYEAIHNQWIGSIDLNEENRREFLGFLTRHSVGAGGWKASELLAGLTTEVDGKTVFTHANFASDVLSSRLFQQLFPQLAERSQEWKKLSDQVPEMFQVEATGGKSGGEVFWRHVGNALDPWNRISELGKASLLTSLERLAQEPAELSKAESWKFSQNLGRVLFLDDGEQKSIRKAIEPLTERFRAWRESKVMQVLEGPPYAPSGEIGNTLANLEDSHEKFPLEDGVRQKLAPLLLSYARRANQERDLFLGPYQPCLRLAGSVLVTDILVNLLESDELSAGDRKEVFRFLVANLPHDSSAPREGEQARPFQRLQGYLASLSREEVLELVNTDRTSLNARSLGQNLALLPTQLHTRTLTQIARHKKLETDRKHVVAAARHREQNLRLSTLGLLGYDRQLSQQKSREFDFSDLRSMTGSLTDLRLRSQAMRTMEQEFKPGPHIGMDCGIFLMDTLCARQEEAPDVATWYEVVSSILESNPMVLDGRSSYRDQLESYLLPQLQSLPPSELHDWLKCPHVLSMLKAENAASLLTRLADGKPHQEIGPLAERVSALDQAFELQEKRPLIYQIFKEQLSEQARLQPGQLDQVFPPREGSLEKAAESHAGYIRGLSGMVAAVRSREAQEQIHFLDYLLGRREDMPGFIEELQRALESRFRGVELVSLVEAVRNGRSQLSRAEPMTRLLVTNSFLAGPSSFLESEQGRDQLLEHLLANVRPERRDLARHLAEVLLESHGRSQSLAVSFVLSQSSGKSGQMDEATILNNLFDAYGVPGIKFKQYLAFTSDFAEFRNTFESSQDAAMPLNYYQCIRLLEKQFAGNWPANLEVEGLLGSGSVNLALSYRDQDRDETGVASVARENVDIASDYDFQRLDRLLGLLTRTPEQDQKYGFLKGLAGVIRKSVSLEFDKDAAYRMQQQVQPLYNREVDGWQVRTVRAFSQEHQTIFMERAPGSTARKVLQSDPQTYRSAMGALAQVEMDGLMGVDESGSARPVPLHANPDFHDGQVLIDPESRTVTLLDFGQAVPLSNAERDYGIELLEILGGAVDSQTAAGRLNQRAPQAEPLHPEELSSLLERGEPMDAFVRLLGLMERKGNPVPLGTVHWVLAMNRQRALGVKIGKPVDRALKGLILLRRLGGSLESYNHLRLAGRQLQQLAGSLIPGPLGSRLGLAS